jgi:lipopolysaccharide biosynthesis regulator YciM
LEPRLVDAYLHLGELRRQRGDRDRAINCFQAVLRLKPDDADAREGLRRAQELP